VQLVPRPRRWTRSLHTVLAGTDGPGKRALPLGEFLHPVPLVALVVLALNDHYLKGRHLLPQWLTGKLSDFGGLLFFPLLVTALGDTLLYFVTRVTGWRLDYSLRRWKIVAACVATAAVFTPLELSAAYGDFYTRTLGQIGFPSETYADLTDLLALTMLPLAAWLGWREIRRVPLGRLDVVARRGAAGGGFDDVRRLNAGDPRRTAAVDALERSYAAFVAQPGDAAAAASVSDALATLRE
jgi:hypothetical protein